MSVLHKLMQARIGLQATELKKSGHSKFAGYQYFELGDFMPAINRLFNEHGLCGLVSYGRETATLTITDTETNERVVIESPMSTAALKGCHEVQNLGAVQTYIRRYLWVTAMEIVEHDAIDGSTGKDDTKDTKDAKTALSENTRADFLAAISGASDMDDLKHQFGVAYRAAQGAPDGNALEIFKAASDARKAILMEMAA